jgi:transposase-like protein
MIIQVLHCPHCQGTDIVRHGKSSEGKQRYRCRECREGRGRTFLLDYTYVGQSPEVKRQIVDMAMNASGIRDTARVLHVSPTTVINEIKKRTRAAPGKSGGVGVRESGTGRGGDMPGG